MMCRPVCLALWMVAAPANAQLSDPTEPPPILRQATAAAAQGSSLEMTATPRLQSVLISSKRRVAVIDGETVRLGQRHRGAVLVSVSPTEVVLVRGRAQEILKLYPASPGTSGQGQR